MIPGGAGFFLARVPRAHRPEGEAETPRVSGASVTGLGFEILDLGGWNLEVEVRDWGSGVLGCGSRGSGFRFQVSISGLRGSVSGSRFRV